MEDRLKKPDTPVDDVDLGRAVHYRIKYGHFIKIREAYGIPGMTRKQLI